MFGIVNDANYHALRRSIFILAALNIAISQVQGHLIYPPALVLENIANKTPMAIPLNSINFLFAMAFAYLAIRLAAGLPNQLYEVEHSITKIEETSGFKFSDLLEELREYKTTAQQHTEAYSDFVEEVEEKLRTSTRYANDISENLPTIINAAEELRRAPEKTKDTIERTIDQALVSGKELIKVFEELKTRAKLPPDDDFRQVEGMLEKISSTSIPKYETARRFNYWSLVILDFGLPLVIALFFVGKSAISVLSG